MERASKITSWGDSHRENYQDPYFLLIQREKFYTVKGNASKVEGGRRHQYLPIVLPAGKNLRRDVGGGSNRRLGPRVQQRRLWTALERRRMRKICTRTKPEETIDEENGRTEMGYVVHSWTLE